MRRYRNKSKAQSTLEFTFTMMVTLIILWGMIKVFIWSGRDLMERGQAHEDVLTQPVGMSSGEPMRQLRPLFFNSSPLNAAVDSEIFQ